MNHNEQEFNKASEAFKGVSLSVAEKSSMLGNIYKEAGAAKRAEGISSPFSFSLFFLQHRSFVSLATMLLMVTGTSYAAGDSLPGDALYEVKVKVLEPIGLAVRFDEEAKNEYRVQLLQERVEEIQRLKIEGRLEANREMTSAEAAQKNLADIEASAMFDESGNNLQVSGHVETYNSIVEEAHQLRTMIKVGPEEEEDSATSTPEVGEKERPKPIETLKEDLKGTVKDIEDTTTEIAETVTETVTPASVEAAVSVPAEVVPKIGQ